MLNFKLIIKIIIEITYSYTSTSLSPQPHFLSLPFLLIPSTRNAPCCSHSKLKIPT